jgi:hypothetical protein
LLRLYIGIIICTTHQIQLSFWITLWILIIIFYLCLICFVLYTIILALVNYWYMTSYWLDLILITFFFCNVIIIVVKRENLVEVNLWWSFIYRSFLVEVIGFLLVRLVKIKGDWLTTSAFDNYRFLLLKFLFFCILVSWFYLRIHFY